MPPVLHIIDRRTPRDCLRQLAILAGTGDAVACLGPPPALGSVAFDLPVQAVHAPMGSAALAGRRREMKELARRARAIHAWSLPAASAGEIAANGRTVLLTLPCLPTEAEMPPVPAMLARRELSVTVPTEAALRALTAAGANEGALNVLPPPALPIDGPAAKDRRNRVRQALNLAGDERLIAVPGEMTLGSGHKHASWAHAIVSRYMRGLRLIMPGGGAQFDSVESFVISTGYAAEQHMTGEAFSLGDVLAAADMAVFFHERDRGVSALAAAMAAGLPIAATRTPDVVECVGDEAALLVPPRDPQAASAAITRLITSGDLARALAAAAKERAVRLFAPQRCRAKLEEIYARLQG